MTDTSRRITRDDLEAGFRSLEGEVDERKEQAIGIATVPIFARIARLTVSGFSRTKRRSSMANSVRAYSSCRSGGQYPR